VTLLVLIILVLIWAAVLLPPYLQNRSESRPADSISSFQKQLSVLERRSNTIGGGSHSVSRISSAPSYSAMRMSRSEARKRRRDVLFTLAAAAAITLPLAFMLGGSVWMLQLLCDVLLAGYVVLLVQTTQRAAERELKVRYLPTGRQSRTAEPALLLRRSGS
jgi:hypothetical protein